MNLLQIAYKSIRQRSLASALTALSVALGVMLMVVVLVIFGIVRRSFSQNSIGYHLVIGPRGSDLQLVLSAVYRIQPPIENIPFKFYEDLAANPRIEVAVPICLGDYTQEGGFPIVATTRQYFEIPYEPGRSENDPGKTYKIRGDFVDGAKQFDAVIGSAVASGNGWDLGDTFQLLHGSPDSENAHTHDELFTVTGVLAPTGTPNDRTVFVMLEGFYAVAGHDTPLDEALEKNFEFFGHRANEDDPEYDEEEVDLVARHRRVQELLAERKEVESRQVKLAALEEPTAEEEAELDQLEYRLKQIKRQTTVPHAMMHDPPPWLKEVTAVFVRMSHPPGNPEYAAPNALTFATSLNDGFRVQAVNPIEPMTRLQRTFVGNIQAVLLGMTILIVIVSGVGIFVSIYNSMADRRREIAVMRALGARRGTVFAIILVEAVLLCLVGGIVGTLLGHLAVMIAAPFVASASGLLINPFAWEVAELYLIPALVLFASLIGIVPGLTAYRTDVAQALAE